MILARMCRKSWPTFWKDVSNDSLEHRYIISVIWQAHVISSDSLVVTGDACASCCPWVTCDWTLLLLLLAEADLPSAESNVSLNRRNDSNRHSAASTPDFISPSCVCSLVWLNILNDLESASIQSSRDTHVNRAEWIDDHMVHDICVREVCRRGLQGTMPLCKICIHIFLTFECTLPWCIGMMTSDFPSRSFSVWCWHWCWHYQQLVIGVSTSIGMSESFVLFWSYQLKFNKSTLSF